MHPTHEPTGGGPVSAGAARRPAANRRSPQRSRPAGGRRGPHRWRARSARNRRAAHPHLPPTVAQEARYASRRPHASASPPAARHRSYQSARARSRARSSGIAVGRGAPRPAPARSPAGRWGSPAARRRAACTFSPMPSTTAGLRAPGAGTASARMPAHLASPTSRSLGHFKPASSSASRRDRLDHATPASSGSQPYPVGGAGGQSRPARPRRAGAARWPRGPPAAASARPGPVDPGRRSAARRPRPGPPAHRPRAAVGRRRRWSSRSPTAGPAAPRSPPARSTPGQPRRRQRRTVQIGVRRARHPASLRPG